MITSQFSSSSLEDSLNDCLENGKLIIKQDVLIVIQNSEKFLYVYKADIFTEFNHFHTSRGISAMSCKTNANGRLTNSISDMIYYLQHLYDYAY